ncbi:hypothetical protein WMY93_002198 [Mugilogobius chulae]|uniref:B30.2/SPRY domain-containing protein n=1 Tax=Mugilogobius chulae TaxID=88201 RepID=A0AAW0Q2Z0_9GOBI
MLDQCLELGSNGALTSSLDFAEVVPSHVQRRKEVPVLQSRWLRSGVQEMLGEAEAYVCEFSLDPNTAHKELRLSNNNRTVTRVKKEQKFSDDKDRFKDCPQVLSSTGLSGRCYWEVDWSGWQWVSIAVSYRGTRQRQDTEECVFGYNNLSWSLKIYDGKSSVWHNKKESEVVFFSDRYDQFSGRVGVFLNSEEGYLSFYEVLTDGELAHLHTCFSNFTEPLFPGEAHRKLLLSEDNRTVTCVRQEQQYPDHEDRFTEIEQVLSSTGLSGRCYWEVVWSGEGVGVLLDSEAGYLSFYLFSLMESCSTCTRSDPPSLSLCSQGLD